MIQVWCDVGGTFTDCFVVWPDGKRRSTKVLSSGITKGRVERQLDGNSFIDMHRRHEPNAFWVGAILRFLNRLGEPVWESQCVEHDGLTGRLRMKEGFPASVVSMMDGISYGYELLAGIEAPVLATHLLLGVPLDQALPAVNVRLGTTRGTNALLTRRGARTALLTTRGFHDILRIGYQERPELFALNIKKRVPLYEKVVEIDERLASDGTLLQAIDENQVRMTIDELKKQGIQSLAICLLHGYRYPNHEQLVEKWAREAGFHEVSTSSVIAPMIKLVSRAETTVVDAYLGPVVREYLSRVSHQFGDGNTQIIGESTKIAVSSFDNTQSEIKPELSSDSAPHPPAPSPQKTGERGSKSLVGGIKAAEVSPVLSSQDSTLRVMTSHGGLVSQTAYRGKDSVLSGPAGGAVALTHLADAAGFAQVIGLDMGGTSTDVCRIAGSPTIEYEAIKAGVRLMTPMLAIHTVAAGGGSICAFDGVQWRVGPQSAGAEPGPACYGRGGPLTVTDLNLLLGRIVPEAFPLPLDVVASRKKLDDLLEQAEMSNDDSIAFEMASGLRRIANEHMAAAVRSISIAQGADPRDHALVGFGGAAGQHICEIAEILQMETILDPPDAGLLSALGMGLASITRWSAKGIYRRLSDLSAEQIEEAYLQLESDCCEQFVDEKIGPDSIQFLRTVELRYVGTDQPLGLPMTSVVELKEKFDAAHRQRFGYDRTSTAIEVVALRVESNVRTTNSLEKIVSRESAAIDLPLMTTRSIYTKGNWRDGWIVQRESLKWGHHLVGPGIVLSQGSTTVIDLGWSLEVLSDHSLKLCRVSAPTHELVSAECDPVLREVLAQRLAAIADSMGIILEQTAISVNIKERRDYSCAVFAPNGDLIANAPHVPVHLGAMSETVKAIIAQFARMQPGDCFITNDPYRGGSHLPDVTVITPVFSSKGERIFFTANRAHHAEIGGIAPGSMSPLTKCLEEEGVFISAMHLVKAGQDCSEETRRLLTSARFPSRSVEENMSDIAAQQASNRRGEQFLLELIDEYSWDVIEAYLEHIQAASEKKVHRWLDTFGSQQRSFSDSLDDGTPITAKLIFNKGHLTIDMTGTGAVSSSNFNANPAIVKAAVMYVVRLMIDDDLPLNSGALRPISMIIPPGILNAYRSDLPLSQQPAVAAGNVETSQRIVDCLLGALGVAGASQGTMNNLLMGNSRFGYYETIGGGSGATGTDHGADAVHTHMTNTRLTDPEVLESRYPVRLTRFEIRQGSGGAGQHRGGEGMHRELLMLEDLDVSLVTSRRGSHQPYGMAGGESGAAGENYRIDTEGREHRLSSTCQIQLKAGERIGLKTPGGGGYGNVP